MALIAASFKVLEADSRLVIVPVEVVLMLFPVLLVTEVPVAILNMSVVVLIPQLFEETILTGNDPDNVGVPLIIPEEGLKNNPEGKLEEPKLKVVLMVDPVELDINCKLIDCPTVPDRL